MTALHDMTPAEREAWRTIEAMTECLARRDWDGFFSHFHEDFVGWTLVRATPVTLASRRKWVPFMYASVQIIEHEVQPLSVRVYGDESTVTLRAEVRDKTYRHSADAVVTLEVSDSLSPPTMLDMTPVAGERGVYEASYETTHTGVFRFEATAKTADDELGRARFAVRREDGVVEHYRTAQNRALLERLANATGGSYFAIADVSRLPEAVSFSEAGTVERQVLDLWNMPIVFLLLLLLKAGEWLVRLYWGRL
jgi:ketosteroid isomerase-like protein